MAQTIVPNPAGDTPKVIEDKVRALPANQGLNDFEMWAKIDTEVAAATAAGKLNNNQPYVAVNKHGLKK